MAASAVSRVLSFPSLASAEEELNGQLVEDAKAAARRENFAMAHFHHVERQTGQCSVDLYALLPSPTAIYKEGATGNSTRLWPWRLKRLTSANTRSRAQVCNRRQQRVHWHPAIQSLVCTEQRSPRRHNRVRAMSLVRRLIHHNQCLDRRVGRNSPRGVEAGLRNRIA